MLACDVAGFDVTDHFPVVGKKVEMPSKSATEGGLVGFPDAGNPQR